MSGDVKAWLKYTNKRWREIDGFLQGLKVLDALGGCEEPEGTAGDGKEGFI